MLGQLAHTLCSRQPKKMSCRPQGLIWFNCLKTSHFTTALALHFLLCSFAYLASDLGAITYLWSCIHASGLPCSAFDPHGLRTGLPSSTDSSWFYSSKSLPWPIQSPALENFTLALAHVASAPALKIKKGRGNTERHQKVMMGQWDSCLASVPTKCKCLLHGIRNPNPPSLFGNFLWPIHLSHKTDMTLGTENS